MFKKLLLGIATAYGIYGVAAMDPELQKWKEWTPMVGGMPFPKMAIDGTDEHPEPEGLSDFHKSRERLGYRCFMPKNQEEMDLLYNAYKAGVFKPDWKYGDSRDQEGWSHVLTNLRDELSTRCWDGDMYFVDKFLDHLKSFVGLIVSHPDKTFIGTTLFKKFGGIEDIINLARPHFSGGIYECTLTSEQVTHVLQRIDSILIGSGITKHSMLLSALYLDSGDFCKSEEAQKMMEIIEESLEKGILFGSK